MGTEKRWTVAPVMKPERYDRVSSRRERRHLVAIEPANFDASTRGQVARLHSGPCSIGQMMSE